MYVYTLQEWFFFFCFYCFFGWVYESAYVSIKEKQWVNRGFMVGPFLPLYGSGAITLLLVTGPFRNHGWAVFLAGIVGATLLEYLTGTLMEALFQVRYWDYTEMPLNIKGRVCLPASMLWGIMALLMNYVLQIQVEKLVFLIPRNVLAGVDVFLLVYITGDFALSFKAAMDFSGVLIKMRSLRESLSNIKQRIEGITNMATDELIQKKDTMFETISKYSGEIKNEVVNLLSEYKAILTRRENLRKEKWLARIIRNNPTMISEKYKEIMQELKEHLKRK